MSTKLSKGIFLLPNLFTLAALFAGFYSVIASMRMLFDQAAIAIFIAMLFDFGDGRVARLTNTQTEFGAQFDSMSDLVSFGLAPALLLYSWSLQVLGKPGWLIAFLYTACTALRLARFNIQEPSKQYFFGLATPAAAGVIASFVWVALAHHIHGDLIAIGIAVMSLSLSLLKVSSVPYRSFKDYDFKGKVRFLEILLAMMIIVLVAIDPAHVLLFFFSIYALSGPVLFLWRLLRKSKRKAKGIE